MGSLRPQTFCPMSDYHPNPRIRLLKLWKRLWRENPDKMEETRLRAVASAKATYHGRNQKLKTCVSEWPGEITQNQLKERCFMKAQDFGFKPRSFKTKAVRLGLISYDPAKKLWINRTKV